MPASRVSLWKKILTVLWQRKRRFARAACMNFTRLSRETGVFSV